MASSGSGISPSTGVELPTAEEILCRHRENRERLSRLHIQLEHVREWTEAYGRAIRDREADDRAYDKRIRALSAKNLIVEFNGQPLRGAEAHEFMRGRLGSRFAWLAAAFRRRKPSRAIEPWRIIEPMEFFIDGRRYQRRYQHRWPVVDSPNEPQEASWCFPAEPLTAESLPTAYGRVNIFSRSPASTPAVRIWEGANYPVSLCQLHRDDYMSHQPAFIEASQAESNFLHPIDAFFSRPVEAYRVLGQETIDGRDLILVQLYPELLEEHEQAAERRLKRAREAWAADDANGTETIISEGGLAGPADPANYGGGVGTKAWIDLARGALPVRIESPGGGNVMVAERIVELPNGGFYPAKTVFEECGRRCGAKATAEQCDPELVVHERTVWDCSLVEMLPEADEEFFAFPLPAGKRIWNQDAEKTVGGSKVKPLVEIGEQAPPWKIGRWVDGQERSLESLRGQVVVLDFWAGGVDRNFAMRLPGLKYLHERFAGRPVTFITIHTAERNQAALAAEIARFRQKHQFPYIAAIDAGSTFKDSATRCDYGIKSSSRVIIGGNGVITYVDPQLRAPNILAKLNDAVNRLWQACFQAVGEHRPDGRGPVGKWAASQKIDALFISQSIEVALKKT